MHELAEFTSGSSFFILLKIAFSLSFIIYDRLFVICDRFSNTYANFKFLF